MTYNILIVDDNDNNRFSLRALLQGDENTLYEAVNGTETLAMIIEHQIDLIILDVQLPDYNGFQLAKIIKNRKSTKDIPIILATAVFKAQVFIEQGFEAGAVDYVLKPINGQVLLAKIAHYKALSKDKIALEESLAFKSDIIDRQIGELEAERQLFRLLADDLEFFVNVIRHHEEVYTNAVNNQIALGIEGYLNRSEVKPIIQGLIDQGNGEITVELPEDNRAIKVTCTKEELSESVIIKAKYIDA